MVAHRPRLHWEQLGETARLQAAALPLAGARRASHERQAPAATRRPSAAPSQASGGEHRCTVHCPARRVGREARQRARRVAAAVQGGPERAAEDRDRHEHDEHKAIRDAVLNRDADRATELLIAHFQVTGNIVISSGALR